MKAVDINGESISYLYERMVTLGTEWANTSAAADLLEETRKSLLSQLAADSNETAMNAKEAYALRHPDYWKHVKDMVEARKAANVAKVRFDAAKVYIELLRTQAANERATLKTAP